MGQPGPLAGRAVLVTGGGRNIGRAIAAAAAAAGARVAVLERDPGGGAEAVAGILAAGGEAMEVVADLLDPAAVDAALASAASSLGGLDGLVNNAALYVRKPFRELTVEDWDAVLATNLRASFLTMRAFVREGVRRPGPCSVVAIASVHAAVGDGTVVPHCAAKAGLLGLVRAAADALRGDAVRVNAVSPGAVATWNGPWDAPAPGRPLQSMLVPRQVAEAVVWLLSDGSAPITGIDLPVGGGTAVALRLP